MATQKFEEELRQWLAAVEKGCNELGEKLNLDWYPFQSSVRENPELMVIGVNPGGCKTFHGDRQLNLWDIENQQNEFVCHYNDPQWGRLKSLYELFKGTPIQYVFDEAVITNLVYFNSGNFANFKKEAGWKDAYLFCRDKTLELIEIVKPGRIIIMGVPALDGLLKHPPGNLKPMLKDDMGKTVLIGESALYDIPVLWIHHPCMNRKFNSGGNFEAKKKWFRKIFDPKKQNS